MHFQIPQQLKKKKCSLNSSFQNLTNFVGAQSNELIANGVMAFSQYGLGHLVADDCLHELISDFRGDNWDYNGPGVITRTLKKLCNTNDVS